MVSGLDLFVGILVASAVLAVPSSRFDARLTRRRENCQSTPHDRVESPACRASNVTYSPNCAGAVLAEANGTFTTVTGTFVVPAILNSSGAASAWVGIDGEACQNAMLQAGVDFTITDGKVSYDAWYEWYPDSARDFSNITISAGDVIKATVTAHFTTSGEAVIENLTTGQSVTQNVTSGDALCQQNAEWIVEDFEENGGLAPFADFKAVTFSGATASSCHGTSYTPSDATFIDIEQNNEVLTSVFTSGDTLTIKHV